MSKVQEILNNASKGSRFFSVEFVKLDGSVRKMTCKKGVTKHLKGTGKQNKTEGLETVYEVNKGPKNGYRSFYLDKVLKINGVAVYS